MAIYRCNTGSLSSSLILCCSKYINVTHNFHMSQQRAAETSDNSFRYSDSNSKNLRRRKVHDHWHEKDIGFPTTTDVIQQKKIRAKKSLLVRLNAQQDVSELYSMCSKFGEVKYMYQYETDDYKNFILMEFQKAKTLKDVTTRVKQNTDSLISSCIFNFHGTGAQRVSMDYIPLIVQPKRSHAMLVEKLNKIAEENQTVSNKITAHYNLMKLSALDEKLRYFVACQIEDAIGSMNQNIKAIPFGSTVNGFGKYNSDLDVVLINEAYNPRDEKIIEKPYLTIGTIHSDNKIGATRSKLKSSLHLIATLMPRTIPGIINMSEILSARVPIIRFKHQPTDLSCDLTIDQRAGICMSELLHIFGKFDPRVRPLVLFIREWARIRQLTSPNPSQKITNFSLSLLLIFYLQTKSLLPSLNLLTMYARYCDIMEGDDGQRYSFLRRPELFPSSHLSRTTDNLETLLLGFFEYYAKFKFEKYSISLENGEPRSHDNNSPLFIHNPLNVELNVSKNVNGIQLNILKKHFQDSAMIMKNLKDDTVFQNLLLLNCTPRSTNSNEVVTNISTVKNVNESSECL